MFMLPLDKPYIHHKLESYSTSYIFLGYLQNQMVIFALILSHPIFLKLNMSNLQQLYFLIKLSPNHTLTLTIPPRPHFPLMMVPHTCSFLSFSNLISLSHLLHNSYPLSFFDLYNATYDSTTLPDNHVSSFTNKSYSSPTTSLEQLSYHFTTWTTRE